jgi:hypothetical protein
MKTPAPAEPGTYWVHLSEGDAIDLASGYVPNVVKAWCLRLLDDVREYERLAARPVRPPVKRTRRTR